AIRIDLVLRPVAHHACTHREGWRESVRCHGADTDTTVLVVADGHAGVQARSVVIEDVEVVDTEREDLRTPVRQVARVGVEGLVEADRAERIALRVLTRREEAHRGQGQRTDVEGPPYVGEPRADVSLCERTDQSVRRTTDRACIDQLMTITPLVQDRRL